VIPSVLVAIVFPVPVPAATAIVPFQNTAFPALENTVLVDGDAVHPLDPPATGEYANVFPPLPAATHLLIIHLTLFPAVVKVAFPNPVQLFADALVDTAIVLLLPRPTAIQAVPFQSADIPDTSNTDVPNPVHVRPSVLVANVFPPDPHANHTVPFHVTQ
jgi:hypothetical protein